MRKGKFMKGNLLWLAAVLVGCSAPVVVPPTLTPPTVTRIDAAVVPATMAPPKTVVSSAMQPVALSVVGGVVAAATGDQVLVLKDAAFTALGVGAPGESMTLGTVRALSRRSDAAWVATSEGLFHTSEGRLLKSPLSPSLAGLTVTAVDSFLNGTAEELWLTTSGGLQFVSAGLMREVQVQFDGAMITTHAAVAVAPSKALVAAGSHLFLVDLTANVATWLAKDIGTVFRTARAASGAAYVATSTGLYTRAADGTFAVRTFVASGTPAQVTDVNADYEALVAVVNKELVEVPATGAPQSLASFTAPKTLTLARDARKNTFVLDGADVVRVQTGLPDGVAAVSFAADVKPFLAAHCTACHKNPVSGYAAPPGDFTDYAYAKAKAATIVTRLKSPAGAGVMPPDDFEVLFSSQYAVVVNWVNQGMKP